MDIKTPSPTSETGGILSDLPSLYLKAAINFNQKNGSPIAFDFILASDNAINLPLGQLGVTPTISVSEKTLEKVVAYQAEHLFRLRLSDDPESSKLLLLASNIALRQTRVFYLNANDTPQTSIKTMSMPRDNDCEFWRALEGMARQMTLNPGRYLDNPDYVKSMEKSDGPCVCYTCARCLWRRALAEERVRSVKAVQHLLCTHKTVNRKALSHDDVLDLRIMLNLCSTVQEFLKKIG